MKESWSKMPDSIWRTSYLNPPEKAVIGLILVNSLGFHSDKYHKKVRYQDFAKQLNMNVRAVSKAFKSLRSKKLIKYKQQNNEKFQIHVDIDRCQNITSVNESCKKPTEVMSDNTTPMLNNDKSDVINVPVPPLKKDINKDIYKETLKEKEWTFEQLRKEWLFKGNNEEVNMIQENKFNDNVKHIFNNLHLDDKKRVILSVEAYIEEWSCSRIKSDDRQYMHSLEKYILDTRYRHYWEIKNRQMLIKQQQKKQREYEIETEKNKPSEEDMVDIRNMLKEDGWIK